MPPPMPGERGHPRTAPHLRVVPPTVPRAGSPDLARALVAWCFVPVVMVLLPVAAACELHRAWLAHVADRGAGA